MSISDYDSHLVRQTPKRDINAVGKHWSDSQKIEAVTTWLMLGNGAQTARVLGVPLVTFKLWKTSQWWKELEQELRLGEKLVLSTRLKGIVETALGQVEDRLTKGEAYLTKDGQVARKPVSMRDANKVAMDMLQHRDKLVTTEEMKMQEEGVKEKLEKLAKSFEEFAQKQSQKIATTATDISFTELAQNGDNEHAKSES